MGSIAALILAAGGSSRFGQPKQFVSFDGQTLISRIVSAAQSAQCSPIVVIAGEAVEAIRSRLAGGPAKIIHNTEWQRGLGNSIRCGIRHVTQELSVEAVIILACDQPFVGALTISALITEHHRTKQPIVASSYDGTLGIPALFSRSNFEELEALPENSGAKFIIESHIADVAIVPFPEGAMDIDTPEDYDALLRRRAGV